MSYTMFKIFVTWVINGDSFKPRLKMF